MIGYFLGHTTQIILFLITVVTTALVFTQIDNVFTKLTLIALLSLLYFVFGVLHHLQEKNLTSGVVLEYLVLSILLLWSMLALSIE